ncbi:MAG: hypothetical protein AAGC90_00835 [Curtobacterium sp.]|jgi:hypothetical protein|uniref:hypothetical protein n=1 Tax=unclassified Curtobacterium TaxID=257496 RepID=UPI0031B24A92
MRVAWRVLRWLGSTVVAVLQVLAGVMDSLGSGGATGPRVPPTTTRAHGRRDEYRP